MLVDFRWIPSIKYFYWFFRDKNSLAICCPMAKSNQLKPRQYSARRVHGRRTASALSTQRKSRAVDGRRCVIRTKNWMPLKRLTWGNASWKRILRVTKVSLRIAFKISIPLISLFLPQLLLTRKRIANSACLNWKSNELCCRSILWITEILCSKYCSVFSKTLFTGKTLSHKKTTSVCHIFAEFAPYTKNKANKLVWIFLYEACNTSKWFLMKVNESDWMRAMNQIN